MARCDVVEPRGAPSQRWRGEAEARCRRGLYVTGEDARSETQTAGDNARGGRRTRTWTPAGNRSRCRRRSRRTRSPRAPLEATSSGAASSGEPNAPPDSRSAPLPAHCVLWRHGPGRGPGRVGWGDTACVVDNGVPPVAIIGGTTHATATRAIAPTSTPSRTNKLTPGAYGVAPAMRRRGGGAVQAVGTNRGPRGQGCREVGSQLSGTTGLRARIRRVRACPAHAGGRAASHHEGARRQGAARRRVLTARASPGRSGPGRLRLRDVGATQRCRHHAVCGSELDDDRHQRGAHLESVFPRRPARTHRGSLARAEPSRRRGHRSHEHGPGAGPVVPRPPSGRHRRTHHLRCREHQLRRERSRRVWSSRERAPGGRFRPCSPLPATNTRPAGSASTG